MLICPNTVVNIANEFSRKLFSFGTLKQTVFPMNDGKRNMKMFIAGVNNAANHWVLVVVKLRPFKRINYCDTLAWDPPSNIHDLVNSYADHILSLPYTSLFLPGLYPLLICLVP